ncbi:DUF2974 domain-containing protein [Ligilactobacillus equi]|uniref:Mbeg1-like protein n=1 Tax=Ligilactobacillus equi TaxID=137357 RepID=UPI002ED0B018
MASILDYIKNTPQTFNQKPLNPIDALILCQATYLDLTVAPNFEQVAKLIKNGKQSLNKKEYVDFLLALGKSPRFCKVSWCALQQDFNPDEEIQFKALTFRISTDTYFIAYQGTTPTFTGWKESLNLSFKIEIPSQISALKYFQKIIHAYPGHYYLGGHSKGGNLAFYTALNAPAFHQGLIIEIYNFDGPGFLRLSQKEQRAHQRLKNQLHKYIPQDSLFGIMLENDTSEFIVVKSSAIGVFQHNLLTWKVTGTNFQTNPQTSSLSQLSQETLQEFVKHSDPKLRAKALNLLYQITKQKEQNQVLSPQNILLFIAAVLVSNRQERQVWEQYLQELYTAYKTVITKRKQH